MKGILRSWHLLLLAMVLTFVDINSQELLPFGSYKQETRFPIFAGQFQTSKQYGNQERQFTAGFHLNAPRSLPQFIPPRFPINPIVFSAAKDSFGNRNYFHLPLIPPPYSLFIPNSIQQKPETKGQEEEYRKYLKETEEEDEKERQQNEITTDLDDVTITSSFAASTPKTFVNVKVQGKEYGYST
ncbi:uncharacterized protein LOC115880108 [Sitophilus oryzae]|uniref:Uncharacterized protein LOC115880108 n=1 Tax=Sitophilus oryzae TaxID=7048 RepID=A0A6J2XR11_SITOR|nr:uncharacterized protein LOC115880108 [Sitophilus oryzae]